MKVYEMLGDARCIRVATTLLINTTLTVRCPDDSTKYALMIS